MCVCGGVGKKECYSCPFFGRNIELEIIVLICTIKHCIENTCSVDRSSSFHPHDVQETQDFKPWCTPTLASIDTAILLVSFAKELYAPMM